MFSILRYAKYLVSFIRILPAIINAAQEVERELREAKQDGNVTNAEILEILEAAANGFVKILLGIDGVKEIK